MDNAIKNFYKSYVLLKVAKLSDSQFNEMVKDRNGLYRMLDKYPDLVDELNKTLPQIPEDTIRADLANLKSDLEKSKGYGKPIAERFQKFIASQEDYGDFAETFMDLFMDFYNDNTVSMKRYNRMVVAKIDVNEKTTPSSDSLTAQKTIIGPQDFYIPSIKTERTPSKEDLQYIRQRKNIKRMDTTIPMPHMIREYLSSYDSVESIVDEFISEYKKIIPILDDLEDVVDFNKDTRFNKALKAFYEIYTEFRRSEMKNLNDSNTHSLRTLELIDKLETALELRNSDKFDKAYEFLQDSKNEKI